MANSETLGEYGAGANHGLRVEDAIEMPPAVGRERRVQARALDLWRSLCGRAALPTLDQFHAGTVPGFAANSVLIDLAPRSGGHPVRHIGSALAREAGVGDAAVLLRDVEPGSMLGLLLRQVDECAAAREPLLLEAERAMSDGEPAVFRGLLLPFASDGGKVDHVYGLISWRAVAGIERIADVGIVMASVPPLDRTSATSPWGVTGERGADAAQPDLALRLDAARTWARLAAGGRIDLHNRAIGAAHDLLWRAASDPTGWAKIAGDRPDPKSVVDLVFGGLDQDRDPGRYVMVLERALRLGIAPGGLATLLDHLPGGLVEFLSEAAPPEAGDLTSAAVRLQIDRIDDRSSALRCVAPRDACAASTSGA